MAKLAGRTCSREWVVLALAIVVGCVAVGAARAATSQSSGVAQSGQNNSVAQNSPAPAQQQGQVETRSNTAGQPEYVIKARVPLTIVDVVVTDAKGHPVHGLKQSDFTVLEDKAEVKPNSFEEHRTDTEPEKLPQPTPMFAKPDLAPDTFTNVGPPPGDRPLNLLLLDSMNTPLAVQATVRQQMLDYIKHMAPGTRMAIFGLTTHLFVMQGFTSDPEVLKAVLTSSAKTMPQFAPLEDSGQEPGDVPEDLQVQGGKMAERGQHTFAAISQIARYLSGMPGRKNLIWFSGAFPMQFPPEPRDPDLFPLDLPQMFDYSDNIKAMGDMLARSHIAVYSIEPRGLDKRINTRKGSIEFGEHGTLDAIADLTGGKNFHNTNGMTEAVEAAIDQGANYYTLTYTPVNQALDTRFRTISVKVDRPDVKLVYRDGYYAVDPATTLAGTKVPKVTAMQSAMMRGSLEPTQILFKVNVAQMAGTEETLPVSNTPNVAQMKPPYRHYTLSFAIDVNGIEFTPSMDGNYRGAFEYGVMVYNADGDALMNSASKTVSPILPPAVYQSMRRGGANAHMEIDVPAKGEYFLRVAVHDLSSDRVGAIEIPVSSITPAAAPVLASQE